MAYRALRKAISSSSLERKCRLLFGASLLLLIFGSFWWYGRETEDLVHQKRRNTGRQMVDAIAIKTHWLAWETDPELKQLVESVLPDLEHLSYDWDILTLDRLKGVRARYVTDPQERELLTKLRERYYGHLAREHDSLIGRKSVQPPTSDEDADTGTGFTSGEELVKNVVPINDEVRNIGAGEYAYYQPIYWFASCVDCHRTIQPDEFRAYSTDNLEETHDEAGNPKLIIDKNLPFRVVKVIIRDSTERDINFNRSILLTTAIITVFLAMIALYAVVRYVIVKPLRHLRQVSDEIAGGNYRLRAELQTNDEFEDLADSFNRMLRHLVEAQDELTAVNVKLDSQVDELAHVNMQLYETNRLKSDFLANVSHELRTPLNSIIGFSDVLQGIEALNDKQKRYVSNIGKSGRALLEVINDILDLAKMESGNMAVRPTEFAIATVMRSHVNFVQPLADKKNIDLDIELSDDLPEMFQDQGKVQQILTNLLSNAIKFTPEGGRITVSAQRVEAGANGEPELRLTVDDTGVGIAEEDRQAIFEKFRQARATVGDDNLTREYAGTGLGLSIVRELCKLLGGKIDFVSHLGRGSAFTATIPWNIPTQLVTPTSAGETTPRTSSPDSKYGRKPNGNGQSATPSTQETTREQ